MISRNSVVSIYGLYLFDPTLFDGFKCPEGLNRDLVIDSIVMENAELELLYPDGDFMKGMIKLWSNKELTVWQKQFDALNVEYNPLWNKDGTTHERWDYDDTTHTESEGTDQVSAYNETGFHDRAHNDGTGDGHGYGWHEYERKEYGNIGVTTSQQMLQSEIDLRQYNFIMQVFRDITDLIGLPIY